ncbi:MFS transporter [Pyruvatibacter mobilis]|uniref:MFS transporter n=1 Tax=Pyruvatibacter mobilis TaxID=1712261 RepID=A0A845QB11_9HYPH|nr:RsmB/NOP family class I SAM-dependent RNA methyltransferase [Pyruvatibacter mobilis]NBG95488.1 MFS transporter [Pyruvatibacter mobilis]QJD75427.1 RsmB/NOP family class I SAM-dependent RNA methyltransferase [Pyruvatibacter mobilis]GGD15508.1 rRNA cytosine-C5-methylase [Pyruvatibacter mobilis]
MTPAARIAAAIEIIEEIEQGLKPADDVVRQWGRSHRFAGAKDRRAISERVYAVLRRRGLYAAAGNETPRALVMADLVLGEGQARDDVVTLFSGEGHAPAPLDDDEQAVLSTLMAASGQDLPAYDVPDFMLQELTQAFGADLDDALAALDRPAPVDLRVNTLKVSREEAATILADAGIDTEPTPHSPIGLRVKGSHLITGTQAYKQGLVEPMDEGSQLAALAVAAEPGMQVLDMCAGAGGKTLAIAAAMDNSGQIYATDTDARRLGNLAPRMKRAGARNIQPLPWPQDASFEALNGKCDRVLLDVPCSGSGSWRRHPEQKWRVTPDDIERLTKTQTALLRSAAPLVKPGGRLVYITCSVLPAENEARIDAFLEAHPDFAPHSTPTGPRLAPHTHGTDGFFIRSLQRQSP